MLKNFARRLDVEPWVQIVASVRARTGDELHVAADTGPVFVARRALSCLVEPEPGARVLVARSRRIADAYVG